jgi:hypothetical protein
VLAHTLGLYAGRCAQSRSRQSPPSQSGAASDRVLQVGVTFRAIIERLGASP